MLLGDMGIPLGCCYGCVSQKRLYYSYINAVPEQKRRYGVPQHVRSNVAPYPCLSPQSGNDVSHPLG